MADSSPALHRASLKARATADEARSLHELIETSIWTTDTDLEPVSALVVVGKARLAVDDAEEMLRAAVAHARSENCSWSEIGTHLGVSKQAAHERFRDVDAVAQASD